MLSAPVREVRRVRLWLDARNEYEREQEQEAKRLREEAERKAEEAKNRR